MQSFCSIIIASRKGHTLDRTKKERNSEMTKNIIEVKNLTKKYKENIAVDHLSFEVKEGEILGLLGPNGCGKSTTINCLLSLLTINEGEIKIFDKKMTPNAYDIKQKIGVVFQDVALFDELTVIENIDYFCGLYIKEKEKRKKCIEDACKLVGLEDYKKYYPKQLSGGLLRRLNIACGIAHKPSLIFFDEPTVAVDPQSRNHILDGIKRLREEGATIIYTTHYMEEVELLCDRIIIMDQGKIIASGTMDEVKALAHNHEKISVQIMNLEEETKEKLLKKIQKLQGVIAASFENHTLLITAENGTEILETLMDRLKDFNISYQHILMMPPTLNDVFLELTGKELRD